MRGVLHKKEQRVRHDAHSNTLLRHIHQGAPAEARLFLVERVMPDDGQPSPVPLMDLNARKR
ncbi:hypothetical protein [Hyalangium sp.]|uniref:hypothetical protein n=1 Tax=Hyalangium sp. TaxID=2028555 RepID=UPI002D33AD2B|nr:hypothetical protein [Hyalangium sp.]HYH96358.1 hypothetical protein [Hyalangium sp.]